MKKFFADFKKFISRGNIVDMSVGVIIGSAFSAIVTALTNKIIMPLINLILSAGGTNGLETAYTFLKKAYNPTTGEIDLNKSIYIDWGAFITAIINFFLIAFVLFIILKAVMKANEMWKGAVDEVTNKDLIKEKHEVRKQAKLDKKSFKLAWSEHLAEKERLANEAKAQKEAEEKAKAEADALANPSEQALLKEIRDLLKAQAGEKKTVSDAADAN